VKRVELLQLGRVVIDETDATEFLIREAIGSVGSGFFEAEVKDDCPRRVPGLQERCHRARHVSVHAFATNGWKSYGNDAIRYVRQVKVGIGQVKPSFLE